MTQRRWALLIVWLGILAVSTPSLAASKPTQPVGDLLNLGAMLEARADACGATKARLAKDRADFLGAELPHQNQAGHRYTPHDLETLFVGLSAAEDVMMMSRPRDCSFDWLGAFEVLTRAIAP